MKRKQLTLSLAAAAVLAAFNPAQAQTVNANPNVDANAGIANSDVNAGVNLSPGIDVTAQQGAPGTQSGQTANDINSSSTLNQGVTQDPSASSASGGTAQQGAPGTQSGPDARENSSVAANQQPGDMKQGRYN